MSLVTQNIEFPAGNRQLQGYLARPENAGPFPGLIVIHEIFGLNQSMRDITERFAREGYAALAVDLFANRNQALCLFRYMSGMLLNSLNHSGIGELRLTLDYLIAQPYVDSEHLGAIGFCMGGTFATAWACTDPRLKVIAPFYGFNPRPLQAVARSCPVVGSFPEGDITAKQASALDAALTHYDIDHDVKIYPATRHSFFNTHGKTYDQQATDDAWQRTLAFFGERLH